MQRRSFLLVLKAQLPHKAEGDILNYEDRCKVIYTRLQSTRLDHVCHEPILLVCHTLFFFALFPTFIRLSTKLISISFASGTAN